ncbi:MAG: DUF427 domain-containing protein [Chloroflexi bacterium]|jgi:uncharacterized protein (DUF427 family)|nr:DUF427 domain-containing protein [Chloroflexota bacterium]MBT3669801.1 DUF427 domain-containing protein [Chloroflexota bacterium]MBT4003888.1 DUF427 domain-containing protein [Chloroflexota bacterium]MBT4304702.1 DUF427 domain-containing protein [Chloroflexota bacterium]MBT4534796.1 DUF427 domain-containing protein [Chloroflexota bacterium]
MKAVWNGVVLAESNETVVVEGNYYFPENSINKEYFQESDRNTVCSWKGTASYYSIVVDGKENTNAAWYYAKPSDSANEIKGRVAFWKGVEIQN